MVKIVGTPAGTFYITTLVVVIGTKSGTLIPATIGTTIRAPAPGQRTSNVAIMITLTMKEFN